MSSMYRVEGPQPPISERPGQTYESQQARNTKRQGPTSAGADGLQHLAGVQSGLLTGANDGEGRPTYERVSAIGRGPLADGSTVNTDVSSRSRDAFSDGYSLSRNSGAKYGSSRPVFEVKLGDSDATSRRGPGRSVLNPNQQRTAR